MVAQEKAIEALELLAPLLSNTQTTARWDNVIEMLLLQAQAYQMSHEMQKALAVLTQAVSIAQPEGYISRAHPVRARSRDRAEVAVGCVHCA